MKADLWTIAIATGTVAFALSGVVVALLIWITPIDTVRHRGVPVGKKMAEIFKAAA